MKNMMRYALFTLLCTVSSPALFAITARDIGKAQKIKLAIRTELQKDIDAMSPSEFATWVGTVKGLITQLPENAVGEYKGMLTLIEQSKKDEDTSSLVGKQEQAKLKRLMGGDKTAFASLAEAQKRIADIQKSLETAVLSGGMLGIGKSVNQNWVYASFLPYLQILDGRINAMADSDDKTKAVEAYKAFFTKFNEYLSYAYELTLKKASESDSVTRRITEITKWMKQTDKKQHLTKVGSETVEDRINKMEGEVIALKTALMPMLSGKNELLLKSADVFSNLTDAQKGKIFAAAEKYVFTTKEGGMSISMLVIKYADWLTAVVEEITTDDEKVAVNSFCNAVMFKLGKFFQKLEEVFKPLDGENKFKDDVDTLDQKVGALKEAMKAKGI
jgi:hypothetical protein